MAPWLRLIKMAAGAPFREKLSWRDESVLSFRVWPNDLDINLHMNNARYLGVMDIGRFDLAIRCGLARLVWRRKLKPVVASAMVRFRRSLAPFERFTLRSRIVGWDEKWIFIEHNIERGGEMYCQAIVKALFLTRSGAVPTRELLDAVGARVPASELPDWIAHWQAAEAGARG
jgi:acyl-CoA thioesterase FadM